MKFIGVYMSGNSESTPSLSHQMGSAKVRALELYLQQDDAALIAADESPWGTSPPASELAFDPPLSYDAYQQEVQAQAAEFPDNPDQRVIRSLAMYAGVVPEGDAAHYFTVHRGLSPHIIHPSVQLSLGGRSAKIRAIPPSWQDNVARTPITATMNAEGQALDIWFRDPDDSTHLLATAEILSAATPTPLVYKTGEIMVINPQMVCPLECGFCIHKHLGTRDFGLVNFSPDETADYIVGASEEDWRQLPMIKIITGAFRNYNHLSAYIRGFVSAMKDRTEGSFDPVKNSDQTLHLLTNLVRTPEEMEEVRALGVGSLEHTLEIFDDTKRREQMYRATQNGKVPGKGEQTIGELIGVAKQAVGIYGPAHYAVGIVMGLDDLTTTEDGLQVLHEAGVRQLTGGIFVPNAYEEITLQQMSFADIMRARRRAAKLFTLPNIFADYKRKK